MAVNVTRAGRVQNTPHRLIFPRTLESRSKMPIEKTAKSTGLTVRRCVQGTSMRSRWLYSLLGVALCTGVSVAQAPLDAETTQTPPSVDAAPESPLSSTDFVPEEKPPVRFWASAEYLLWNIPDPKIPLLVGTIPEPFSELVQSLARLDDNSPLWGRRRSELTTANNPACAWRWAAGSTPIRKSAWRPAIFSSKKADNKTSFNRRPPRRSALLTGIRRRPASLHHGRRAGLQQRRRGHRRHQPSLGRRNQRALPTARASLPGTLRLLAGFRHLQFDEGLSINSTSTLVPNGHLPWAERTP